MTSAQRAAPWPAIIAAFAFTGMLAAVAAIDNQRLVIALLCAFAVVWMAAMRLGVLARVERSAGQHPHALRGAILLAALAAVALLRRDRSLRRRGL